MIALIVQARVGSTRLPGKVLKPLLGKPMLLQELLRLKSAQKIDAFIVATTDKKEDDQVALVGIEAGYAVLRGDDKDVLDRYYHAAMQANADIIVRVTGDCPLHDPVVVDEVVGHFINTKCDYTNQPVNYPEGVDTEVFSFQALKASWKEARLPSEREHVTQYIRNNPHRFKIVTWTNGSSACSSMHWSVDTAEDFQFVSRIYEYLYQKNPNFSKDDVIALLEIYPEFQEINKGGTGFEGLTKSLQEDEEWKNRYGNK